jgi:hypothetical protein
LSREEIFVGGTEPSFVSESDYESASGRALLSPDYARWVSGRDNWLGDLVTCSRGGQKKPRPLRITQPLSGMVVRLDPDIAGGGNRLMLQAEASGAIQWQSPTLTLSREGGHDFAILTAGTHEIVARDPVSGELDRARVIVEQE